MRLTLQNTPVVLLALFSAASPLVRSANIDVTVGGPNVLKYSPEFVTAKPGDTIRFIFQQNNHTATQSSLESPCVPDQDGFDSGFVPVAATQTSGFPVAELNVFDTSPIWVYCRQGNHCQQGMVFAVNPGDKFTAFRAAAIGAAASSSTVPSPPSGTTIVTVAATVTVSGQPLTTTYGSYPGSAAPTAAASTDHKVIVGGLGKLTYEPSNITAQVGDTVTFEFRQKNHTVTASSFAAPCRALSATTGEAGFDSGFMSVADDSTAFPSYTITVNDTEPIWAYCRQISHCGQGMVFSVNAIESGPNTFAAFQAKATQLNGTGSTPQPPNNSALHPSNYHGAMIFAFVLLCGMMY